MTRLARLFDIHCAVTFRRVDYDYVGAAAKAARDARPDWGLALDSGRMEQTA